MRVVNFFHRLFNPHCVHCMEEDQVAMELARGDKQCKSCDTLHTQLDIVNFEKKALLDQLIALTNPKIETIQQPTTEYQPVKPKTIPWRVKQQMLEESDRARAEILRNKADEIKGISELEKEMNILADGTD
jgi:hypothetical protein